MCHFSECIFFSQKINFGVSLLVKSQLDIILGCHFRKITHWDIGFDQISHIWLIKFWIIFKSLGYIFEWPTNSWVSFSQKFMNCQGLISDVEMAQPVTRLLKLSPGSMPIKKTNSFNETLGQAQVG